MQLIIELPTRDVLLARNRQRWEQVLGDRALVQLPYRIETNAHGQLIMSPPPSGTHSDRQSQILLEINKYLGGRALAECPISTIDGVRTADIGWYSPQRYQQVRGQIAFETAPEICVEVFSPSNTDSEMQEKKQLYFEAGAEEVWFCDLGGNLSYYLSKKPTEPVKASPRCPQFPRHIE